MQVHIPENIEAESRHLLDKFQNSNLLKVMAEGFEIKREMHGDNVTYIKNQQINPTNLCVYSCKFCDFAAKNESDHSYILDQGTILDMIEGSKAKEVHMTGGIWPVWGFKRSLKLIEAIRSKFPSIWIKAYTAVEIKYFSKKEGLPIVDVIRQLKGAGVNALAGGGAEILSDRVHNLLYKDKLTPDEWLEVHGVSHEVGLRTNATMLFGHIETDEEIINHLLHVRDQQARTGGFDSFIPLAYQVGNTRLVERMAGSVKCLKVIAMSRIILDNVPHIKSYWPCLNIETASAAVSCGADDMDGTIGKERIMQFAKTASPTFMIVEDIETMIRDAGQTPVERYGDFQHVEESTD